MAKKYKVKHYYGKSGSVYRAKPHPVTIVLVIVLLAGLAYLGTVIYKPAYDFIMNIGKPLESSSVREISVPESEPEAEPESEPEPPKPEYLKLSAVYMPHATASNPSKLDAFLDGLSGSSVNAVMIDIKNQEGDVLFKTSNQTAQKWGVTAPDAVDIKAFAQKLEAKGLKLAVRMSAFRDAKAASAGRLDYAISYQNSGFLWLDNAPENGGKPWLNPYSALSREYLISLALEAVEAGAVMIALENVRFPDSSGVYATFGDEAISMSRAEVLKAFVSGLAERAEEKSARVAVYFPVTDITRTEGQDNRYGGSILKISGEYVMLGVQPSLSGNGLNENGLEVTNPLGDPAGAVNAAISYAEQGFTAQTKIIPVLQGGNDSGFNDSTAFTSASVAAQIGASSSLGLEEYVLYNADGEYLLP